MEQEFELLDEEISPGEVRELLRRLGEREFGGAEMARVGDLVEATGAKSATVAKLLADIRTEAWEAKFGRRQDAVETKVDHHEKWLRKHDHRLEEIAKTPESKEKSEPRNRTDREIYDAVQREEYRRQTPIALTVLAILVILFLVFINQTTPKRADYRENMSFTVEGKSYRYRDGRWQSISAGNEPIKNEVIQKLEQRAMSASASRPKP